MTSRLVLASGSPRRRQILEALGIPFEVVVPEVEELRVGRPEEVVLENARRKARVGLEGAGEGSAVLAVDTDVVLDGGMLGKPADEVGARERLEALSGRTHEVLGGLVLLDGGADGALVERSGLARSSVTFGELNGEVVGLYLASGEWRDRAGAYAVQGLGSILVERVEGDVSNVIGLPVGLLVELAPELFTRKQ